MNATNAAQIDEYLSTLRKAMVGMDPADRDEMIDEIHGHIMEQLEAQGDPTDEKLRGVLYAVGDPEELASEYKNDATLRRAARSYSPWTLLRSTLKWTTTGIAGFVTFCLTAIAYIGGIVSLLCAVLKPFFPYRVGLWISPQHTVTLGYWNGRLVATEIYGIAVRPYSFVAAGTLSETSGSVREILGPWLIPFALVLGVLLIVAATYFNRWFLRTVLRRRSNRVR